MSAPNRNTLWAQIFVDELARSGLKVVCIAPGSRSTPLTLAFADHPAIKVYSHLDERSAGFFALGLALASDEPVALVCTSGSAAANFFPAIVEAHQSHIPLIVLTADRPHELRFSGANQTIDQVKMYGGYALWSVDVALPEASPPALAIRSLRTTANRAYAKANGLRKGVVHVNLPFRKPLEPTPVETDNTVVPDDALPRDDVSFTQLSTGLVKPESEIVERLAALINQHERGLIVCGTRCPVDPFSDYVAQLARAAGYPIIADGTSGVRFGVEGVVGAYDTFLTGQSPAWDDPDIVLHFGGVPTSQPLNDYLNRIQPKYRIRIAEHGDWADDSHRLTDVIQASEWLTCAALLDLLTPRESATWTACICEAERATWVAIEQEIVGGAYFDGAVMWDVIDLIPTESSLFVGSSLPVRHLDQFGKPTKKRIYAYGNRGASGIDGNVSTALGIGAAHPDRPLALVVGDITLYHDMNGLLAVKHCGVPVTLVLLNNDGGGIFHRLPIKDYEPAFTDLFITPHGLDFRHAAALYGLGYTRADDRESFRAAFSQSIARGGANLIEVRTDATHDLARRREIIEAVKNHPLRPY